MLSHICFPKTVCYIPPRGRIWECWMYANKSSTQKTITVVSMKTPSLQKSMWKSFDKWRKEHHIHKWRMVTVNHEVGNHTDLTTQFLIRISRNQETIPGLLDVVYSPITHHWFLYHLQYLYTIKKIIDIWLPTETTAYWSSTETSLIQKVSLFGITWELDLTREDWRSKNDRFHFRPFPFPSSSH